MISVIIPSYNGKELLDPCLSSLERQSFTDFKTIVVDNNSADGSVSFVRDRFPQVRVFQLERNLGFAGAVNRGIEESRGDFIFTLNNDATLQENCLKELLRAMSNDESVGFCAAKMLFMDSPDIINSAGLGLNGSGLNHDRGFGMRDGGEFAQPRYVFGACSGAALYRKSMLDDIGLFDEDFFMFYEDVDISFRAQLRGYRCLYVPSAVVYHKDAGSHGYLARPKSYHFCRNSLIVAMKDLPATLWLKYGPRMLWTMAKQAAAPLVRGGDLSAVKGYLSAIGTLPATLRKRRQIQDSRKVTSGYIDSLLKENRDITKRINLRWRAQFKGAK